MDKIKTVKIKNEDGSISEESYTISVDARSVDMDNGKELQETIGTIDIDTDGNIAEQLENLNDNVEDLNIDIKKKAYFFDTVADMKNVNLKVGDYVCTLGYYAINDGGGAEYKIVSSTNKYAETLTNNLKAELVIKNIVTPEQFGAYGDGTHDDTQALNETFKYLNIQMKKNAIYKVRYIDVKVPSSIVQGNNATISIDTNILSGQKSNGLGNYEYRDLVTYDTFIMENLNFNGHADTFDNYQSYSASQICFLLVSLNKYKYAKIKNCNFQNCIQDALWVINTNRVEIIGNTFKNIATAKVPAMVGTLNAITAMSDRTETSTLLIKDNTFNNVHDSAARIDDFGTTEFCNNVCKNINFVTCETFWNSRNYQCILNVYGNVVNNTSFFITAGYEINKELKSLDLNVYNNNVKGLGFNQIGSANSCGKFVSIAYGTVECNANVYNNVIEADYTDGCIFYSAQNYINVHDNRINIKAIFNESMGGPIITGREVYFKNNYLKYDIANLYILFNITKNSNDTRLRRLFVEDNVILLKWVSRLVETGGDVDICYIKNNEFILKEDGLINEIFQGSNTNPTTLNHFYVLNNVLPTDYIFETTTVNNLFIKNNIFKTNTNLIYRVSAVTNKVVDDNLLVL